MLNDTILLIDAHGLIFKAYHVHKTLRNNLGEPIGAVYGFTKMLIKILNDFLPEKIAIVFDAPGKNFRHEIYDLYKAHRPQMPEDLVQQIKKIKIILKKLNILILEYNGFEADDVIATIITKISATENHSIIISSDKDMMQLINSYTRMYDPTKAQYISEEEVFKKFGVEIKLIQEVMALMGDRSDNIPGVAGIGPKTAAILIQKYGSVIKIYDSLDEIVNLRLKNLLKKSEDLAFLSLKLIRLKNDIEIKIDLSEFKLLINYKNFISILEENEFYSLINGAKILCNKIYNRASCVEIDKETHSEGILLNANNITFFIQESEKIGLISILLLNNKLFLGLDDKCYILDDNNILFNKESNIIYEIKKLLKNQAIKKITYDLKILLKFFKKELESIEDIKLMQYILDNKNIKYSFIEKSLLDEKKTIKVIQKLSDIYYELLLDLKNQNLLHIYQHIELPICYIIHQMEKIGILVNKKYLSELSNLFSQKISILEQEIFFITKEKFNINSPKQLGKILFEGMKLPFYKFSKQKQSYSTDSKILIKLENNGYNIAKLILKWRHLTKLKNTYIDILPKQVHPISKRLHSTFLQTITSTGRLTSQNPNLQIIPINSEEGNEIRRAFIAQPKYNFISADYSQIELRVLSEIANVTKLKNAFFNQEDIHRKTASEIFNIELEQVSSTHRRKAKTINFSIIYGITPFGLSEELNISPNEANEYIKQYYIKYPEILNYINETKVFAKKHGYVKTLLGRKCFLSQEINEKAFERSAINAPIQGSSAEIIKLAMININKELKKLNLKSKLILQIHDELIFEVEEKEEEIMIKLIKEKMEERQELNIPLLVNIKKGKNLKEMKQYDTI